jgi:hypothetical protein
MVGNKEGRASPKLRGVQDRTGQTARHRTRAQYGTAGPCLAKAQILTGGRRARAGPRGPVQHLTPPWCCPLDGSQRTQL